MRTPGGRLRQPIARVLVLVALGTALACSGATDTDEEASPLMGCEPGTTAVCYCTNGLTGSQTCADDRTYDECVGCTAGGTSEPPNNVNEPLPTDPPTEAVDPGSPDSGTPDPTDPT